MKAKRTVNRSAVTGEFVTSKEVKENPRETVKESVKSSRGGNKGGKKK